MTRVEHLRGLLARYRPADRREARYCSRILELLDGGGDPFARDRFDPGHLTASAFVLSPEGSRLLLVRHSKLGFWVQPGGHVDPGDGDVLAAARREVAEESGLTGLVPVLPGIFDVDVHAFPAAGDEPAHAHLDVRFLFRAAGAELMPGPGEDEVDWVAIADVAGRAGPGVGDESVGRAVDKLRRLSPGPA